MLPPGTRRYLDREENLWDFQVYRLTNLFKFIKFDISINYSFICASVRKENMPVFHIMAIQANMKLITHQGSTLTGDQGTVAPKS